MNLDASDAKDMKEWTDAIKCVRFELFALAAARVQQPLIELAFLVVFRELIALQEKAETDEVTAKVRSDSLPHSIAPLTLRMVCSWCADQEDAQGGLADEGGSDHQDLAKVRDCLLYFVKASS
jgi:hypothetical protein